MPSRNLEKMYLAESYYHVYNRGVNRCDIYSDSEDYSVFLNLLKRYLSKEVITDKKGREYDNLYNRLELLSYCLMPNHFHLLLYQVDEKAMERLMRGILTSYTTYFNKKYKRVGHLFQDRYKASRITDDVYLQHISRYIHLNPKRYTKWEYSSLPYYLGDRQATWVRPTRILELFSSVKAYQSFVADNEDYKTMLDLTKQELAAG